MRLMELAVSTFGERQQAGNDVEKAKELGFVQMVRGDQLVTGKTRSGDEFPIMGKGFTKKAIWIFKGEDEDAEDQVKDTVTLVYADCNPQGYSQQAKDVYNGKVEPYRVGWLWFNDKLTLKDGRPQRVYLYCVDWRGGGRVLTLPEHGRGASHSQFMELERNTDTLYLARKHITVPSGFRESRDLSAWKEESAEELTSEAVRKCYEELGSQKKAAEALGITVRKLKQYL